MYGHKLTIETDCTIEGTKIFLDGVDIGKQVNHLRFECGAMREPTLNFVAVAPHNHTIVVPLPDFLREDGTVRRRPDGFLEVEFK
jgi:hypothetical protein